MLDGPSVYCTVMSISNIPASGAISLIGPNCLTSGASTKSTSTPSIVTIPSSYPVPGATIVNSPSSTLAT